METWRATMILLLQDVRRMWSGMSAAKSPFKLTLGRNQNQANSERRQPRRESTSNPHVGRGGAANIFKPSAEEIEQAKRDSARSESAVGDDENLKRGEKKLKGLADKGKDWLLGRK